MSAGKVAAQAAHAAVEAYRLSLKNGEHTNVVNQWYKGGHYTKLVMAARDTEHLRSIKDYIEARGFKTSLIIDEGHTEIPAITPTALGVEVVDKDDPHTAATFESFELLKQERLKEPLRYKPYQPSHLWGYRAKLVLDVEGQDVEVHNFIDQRPNYSEGLPALNQDEILQAISETQIVQRVEKGDW